MLLTLLCSRPHSSGLRKGELKTLCSGQNSGNEVGVVDLAFACIVHCDLQYVCLQLSPCATRAFPWECGLLFKTPGIAIGVLLVQLM